MNAFKDAFINTSAAFAKKKALSFFRGGSLETEISYGELDSDSNRMANTLISLGVSKGDRVILFFPKSLVFITAHIALMKIGAIVVPLNPGYKKSEMDYFIRDADPILIIFDAGEETAIKRIGPGIKKVMIHTQTPYESIDFFRSASDKLPLSVMKPDDAGLILYTSGTTGKPKGAVLTQRNLIHNAKSIMSAWQIKASDVLCHALPLYHAHGLTIALHPCLLAGAHVILLDQFSPDTVGNILLKQDGKHSCTLFMAVPTMYKKIGDYLGDRKRDFRHIRLWTSGSAPLLVKDFQRLKKLLGKEPVEREGMSETGVNFSNPLSGKRKPGSIGLPLSNLEVRIVHPETKLDVEPGRPGELWLKSPSVTPGYWRNMEETEKVFHNGWFMTGDLGRVDEEGYYYLTDRMKHIIISGGENISPKEVEGIINDLEDVLESSVVGLTDEKWGEKVVAAVATKPGITLKPSIIQAHCREHLHSWKCPKKVVFVNDLPKNTMGKVLIEEVKKLFQ
jgi:malonyl-CoA/methylmalonyl-CoA synthetase